MSGLAPGRGLLVNALHHLPVYRRDLYSAGLWEGVPDAKGSGVVVASRFVAACGRLCYLQDPGYVWVRVSQFQERTIEDFSRKVEEIYKAEPGLKGMVLDLRNDPGGLLDAAVALSAAFLPEGVTVDYGLAEERLRNAIRTFPKDAKEETATALRALAALWISENRNADAAKALISRAEALEN
jgi:hypothetical protein